MAIFLFGAGATRGASFVNPADNPCLPPLDFDFYAQLQRIANLKHKQTVRDVLRTRKVCHFKPSAPINPSTFAKFALVRFCFFRRKHRESRANPTCRNLRIC